jgi:hypothetical protein
MLKKRQHPAGSRDARILSTPDKQVVTAEDHLVQGQLPAIDLGSRKHTHEIVGRGFRTHVR